MQDAIDHPSSNYQGELAEPGYRPMSIAAIAAAVLGLLSPLVLFGSLLVVLPIAAIVLAFVALKKTAPGADQLAGRSLAMLGLAIAAFSLSALVARGAVADWRGKSQADAFSQYWLRLLVEGREEEAFLLTVDPSKRSEAAARFSETESSENGASEDGATDDEQAHDGHDHDHSPPGPGPGPGPPQPGEPSLAELRDEFDSNRAIQALLGVADSSSAAGVRIEWRSIDEITYRGGSLIAPIRYELSGGELTDPLRVVVTVWRGAPAGGRPTAWAARDVQFEADRAR